MDEIKPLDLLNVIEVEEIISMLAKCGRPDLIKIFMYIIQCANDKINDEGFAPDNLLDEVEDAFSPNLSDHSSDADTDENEDYDAREPLK
jgi:hypothetical protein